MAESIKDLLSFCLFLFFDVLSHCIEVLFIGRKVEAKGINWFFHMFVLLSLCDYFEFSYGSG